MKVLACGHSQRPPAVTLTYYPCGRLQKVCPSHLRASFAFLPCRSTEFRFFYIQCPFVCHLFGLQVRISVSLALAFCFFFRCRVTSADFQLAVDTGFSCGVAPGNLPYLRRQFTGLPSSQVPNFGCVYSLSRLDRVK